MKEIYDKWVTCDECSALIETDDHQGLLGRAIESYKRQCPENWFSLTTAQQRELTLNMEEGHSEFWSMRHDGRRAMQQRPIL